MKRKIKLFLALFVCAILFCASFTACSGDGIYSEGDGELHVLCTSFAPFDFVREVGGERVKVSILQDSGADLHNYTPTAATIDTIAKADVFVYIGGTSDKSWIQDAIRASGNKDLITLCLMDTISPIYAELENDWTGDDHDHENDHTDNGDHTSTDHDGDHTNDHDIEHTNNHDGEHSHDHSGHDHGADEHIWTSVKNAKLMTSAIKDLLSATDPEGAKIYEANAKNYITKLEELDRSLEEIANRIPSLLFADRFPFVYLLHDYHIPYKAAFSGCSTEVNAGFETQIKLIESVKENGLKFIFIIEGGSKDLADAVSHETGCNILTLDSMQSVKRSDIISGTTYLSVMQKNIDTLKEAYP